MKRFYFLSLLIANFSIFNAQTVSTFSGSGIFGFAEGVATSARFNSPRGIAKDHNGNFYVADTGNHRIRKVNSSGDVSTIGGQSTLGSTDGNASISKFYQPFALAVDNGGNLYIADSGNHKIRKISASGITSTIAGNGSSGSSNGTGNSASFNSPRGITVDNMGNVYVADTYNQKIRKISTTGVVTTVAGSGQYGSIDGAGTVARFSEPTGIAVDSNGDLYIADSYSHKIRKVTSSGVVSTFAGSGSIGSQDGSATTASFRIPYSITLDEYGNFYVAELGSHNIRKISPSGYVTTVAGTGSQGNVDGPINTASFNNPSGIAPDNNGNLFVIEGGNHKIRKITSGNLSAITFQSFANLKIYPNPFTDVIHISDSKNIKKIEILDLSGRLVKTIQKPAKTVLLQELKSAIYLMILHYENSNFTTVKISKK